MARRIRIGTPPLLDGPRVDRTRSRKVPESLCASTPFPPDRAARLEFEILVRDVEEGPAAPT
jgi:hypothetical protein